MQGSSMVMPLYMQRSDEGSPVGDLAVSKPWDEEEMFLSMEVETQK